MARTIRRGVTRKYWERYEANQRRVQREIVKAKAAREAKAKGKG